MKAAKRTECPKCGKTVAITHMLRHLKSQVCKGRQEIQAVMNPIEAEMKARDWVRIGHPAYIKTLDKANVPYERNVTYANWNRDDGLYTTDGTWIPKWANDIVSNKSLVKKRVAVLTLCVADEEKRDAIHSIMLMTNKRERDSAINQLYKDWDL